MRSNVTRLVAVVGLLAGLFGFAPTGGAQAAATIDSAAAAPAAARGYSCRTSVSYFGTEIGAGNRVQLNYTVTCSQTMRVIRVAAAIDNNTDGDEIIRGNRQCQDTNYCTLQVFKRNPSGKQNFAGRGIDSGAIDNSTFAVPYSGSSSTANDWPCTSGQCVGSSGLAFKKATL